MLFVSKLFIQIKLPYLTAYKMHPNFSRANQEKKLVSSKIISKWYGLGYIYEVGLLVKRAIITIKWKIIEKKRVQAYKNFIIVKGKKTK